MIDRFGKGIERLEKFRGPLLKSVPFLWEAEHVSTVFQCEAANLDTP